MQNSIDYLIDGTTGALCRVELKVTQLRGEKWVVDQLAAQQTVEIQRLLTLPGNIPVHIRKRSNDIFATVDVPFIDLLANYKTLDGGVVTPSFARNGTAGELELNPRWFPPPGCRLKFMVHMNARESGYRIQNCYLSAADPDGRHFGLPLPNTHEDNRVCMGEFNTLRNNIADAVAASVTQFFGSRWNSDLEPDMDRCANLFSFKVNGDKLEQIPHTGDWRELCDKVANNMMEMIVV